MPCAKCLSLTDAQEVILRAVHWMGEERTGIINTLGRTIAEDVFDASGSIVIPNGTVIGPFEMAILAEVGHHGVAVSRKPRISIITIGDNIVDVIEPLVPGKQRNTNRYELAGMVFQSGCDLGRLIHCSADASPITRAIQTGSRSDIILLCAGSENDSIAIHESLDQAGRVLFENVAIYPAGQSSLADTGERVLFALPGGAFEAAIAFELLVRPAINAMLGRCTVIPHTFTALTKMDIHPESDLPTFMRARVAFESGALCVESVPASKERTSGVDNALIALPENSNKVLAGDEVQVLLVPQPN